MEFALCLSLPSNNIRTKFIVQFFSTVEWFTLFQRWKYFFNFFNWISLILVATTFAFVAPSKHTPCLFQWRAGWMAHFLAWINFIMYLRRYKNMSLWKRVHFSNVLAICVYQQILISCREKTKNKNGWSFGARRSSFQILRSLYIL